MKKTSLWHVLPLLLFGFVSMMSSCSSDDELMHEDKIEETVEYLFSLNDSWDDSPSSVPQPAPEKCTLTLPEGNIHAEEQLNTQPYYLYEISDNKSVPMENVIPQGGKKRGKLVNSSSFHKTFTLWSTGDVFSETKMTNIAGTQKYSPNKRVAWGNNTQATVYGIAPYNEDAYEDMSVEDGTFTYTTPSVPTEQDDIMVSKIEAKSTDNVINFPFTHALSAIRFKVGDNGIEYATELVRITISGIYTKGTYSFETGEWVGIDTGSITQEFNDVKDWETGHLFTDDGKGTTFFVLPQTAPDEAKIHITLVDEVYGEYTLTSKIGGKTWTKGHAKAYKVSKVFEYGELFAVGAVPFMYDNSGGSGTMYICSSRYKINGDWVNVIGPVKPARWVYEQSSTDDLNTSTTELPSWVTLEKLGGGGATWNFDRMSDIEWETFNITVAPNPGTGYRYCYICFKQPGSNNRIWVCIWQGPGYTEPSTNLQGCVTVISGLRNEGVGAGNIMLGTGNVIHDGYSCIINGHNSSIGYAHHNAQPPQRSFDNWNSFICGNYSEILSSNATIYGDHSIAGWYGSGGETIGSRLYRSGNWYINPWPQNN